MAADRPTHSDDFYAALPAFRGFEGFSDPANYRPLPEGWIVVLADIQGSTKAIRAGRYKDVNMMGAACITSTLNALRDGAAPADVPYVFGGDGATLAIPAHVSDLVCEALSGTRSLCAARFDLGLRIGLVPVEDVRALGHDVLVAKLELSPGNHLALFSGGGIQAVDALIKDPERGRRYRIEDDGGPVEPDLEGLSCRWSPVATQNGAMVSVLIAVPGVDGARRAEIFGRLFEQLRQDLDCDIETLSPATDAGLEFRWPPRFLSTEVMATAARGAWGVVRKGAGILFESAVQWILHRFGGRAGGYDADAYKAELIANTDYRRFDDVLRLVLDCTDAQFAALEACLAAFRESDGVAYGLHAADTALMTCLVFSLEDSQHVHFIDGGDGGFTVAAVQLKAQLAGRE